MLFSRGLLLFEGDTEEQSLPAFAERFFKQHPNTLGLSLIGVGGYGNYAPFLRLAKTFGIPWFIFSDGEPKAIDAVNSALQKVAEEPVGRNSNVFTISNNRNFEAFIATPKDHQDALIEMIIRHREESEEHRAALHRTWDAKTNKLDAIINELESAKTTYGAQIPEALSGVPIPDLLLNLFKTVDHQVGTNVGEGM